jgi:hypothetical protein
MRSSQLAIYSGTFGGASAVDKMHRDNQRQIRVRGKEKEIAPVLASH